MSPTIVLSKCNDPNWERVDPEDCNVKSSSSFMYFENGLDGVLKARQDAEALIAANPRISSLLRGVILASTFTTIDRKEKYFLEIEAKKKKKRDLIIEINDVEHGHDLLMPKKKKIKVEETHQEPTPIVHINASPCIVTATKLIFPSSPSIVGATRRHRPSEKRKISDDNDQGGTPVEGAIVTATRLIFPSIPATSPSSSSSSSVPSKKKRRKVSVDIPTNNDESATAIVKVQKATRGFLARKLYVDRRIAAVTGYGVVIIQKLARGFLTRSHLATAEVQQKKVAATSTVRIQKHVRGFLARKRLHIDLLPVAASTQATTTTTVSCHSNNDSNNDTCCICLEVPNQNAAKIDCGCDHRFCYECILKWGMEKSNTCPYCREKFHEITTTCMDNSETKTTQLKDHNSRSDGIESPFVQMGLGWYAVDISAEEDSLVNNMEEWHRNGRAFSIQQYIEHIRANQDDPTYGPLETDQEAQIFEVMIRTAHEMPNYPQYIARFPPLMHSSAQNTWHEILYAQTKQAQDEILEAQRQGPVQVEQCLQKYRRLSRLA
jgi:hypothetical protein